MGRRREQEHVIARLEIGGKKFEVLVDPEAAMRLREGKQVDPDELLVGDYVYRDVRRALKASPEELRKVFGTDDVKKIAVEIVKRGEIQMTAEQRRRLIEQKKKQIIMFIARNAIDARTKLPVPPQRIEAAMEEAGVGVDPFKPVEEQAMQIIRALQRILPLKVARALLRVRIPPEYAPRVYSELQRLGEVKSMDWKTDGSLVAELEIPAGMQQEVIDRLNKLTRGQVEVKIVSVV